MIIDDTLISKLEKLSRLKLKNEEKEQIKQDLNKILGMFDKLSEVNTDDVEPLRYILDEHSKYLRDDTVSNELTNSEALKNAEESQEPFFVVPKFLKK